jgi:hypothetical protein
MEREEYRAAMIDARPRWATIRVNHADWAAAGDDKWEFEMWTGNSRVVEGSWEGLISGYYTHVLVKVEGAGEDLDGEYTGEVIDFDPYRGEFYVEFS